MPSVIGSQQAKLSGTWKIWSRFWAKHGGTWKRPLAVYSKSGGSWIKVWDEGPRISGVSTYVVDFGTGTYFNFKTFTLYANGFATTVTVDGTLQSTEAVDSVTSQSAVRMSYFPNDYPNVVVANASGFVSF